MIAPLGYPRIPHLVASAAAGRDDLVLAPRMLEALLEREVVVEEKLDGANVMLWRTPAGIQAATRGGPGAVDRAGQLGPLRAWVARHVDALDPLLVDGRVLYGEWLWLQHGVHYDRLRDYLVCLDVWEAPGRWLGETARQAVLGAAGLQVPPEVFRGKLDTVERVADLLGDSEFADGPAEGLIIRPVMAGVGVPRIAKFVRRDFVPRADARWRRTHARNALDMSGTAPSEASRRLSRSRPTARTPPVSTTDGTESAASPRQLGAPREASPSSSALPFVD